MAPLPTRSDTSAGSDPDLVANAEYKTVVSFIDQNQYLADVPWTVGWLGSANGDNLLEEGEKAEITVWLLRRDIVAKVAATLPNVFHCRNR